MTMGPEPMMSILCRLVHLGICSPCSRRPLKRPAHQVKASSGGCSTPSHTLPRDCCKTLVIGVYPCSESVVVCVL